MAQTNDGGPVFPRPMSTEVEGGALAGYIMHHNTESGMKLLDYFAGQAMTGFVGHNRDHPSAVAKISYAIAHAMLEARDA